MRHIEKRNQARRELSAGALIAALAMGCSATIGEPRVDLFLTCAQALLQTADVKTALAAERFNQFNKNGAPFDGLWANPA